MNIHRTAALLRTAWLGSFCLAGNAAADITGSFVYSASTLDVFLTDNNGFVNSFGQQTLDQVGSVLNLSGESVETAGAAGFQFAGTTTGGVDDPTRASSVDVSGSISGTAALAIDLFSELRLRDNGDGSIAALIVFDIQLNGADSAAYSLTTPGAQFGQLQAITGSILPGDLLTSGRYAVAFDTDAAFSGTWSLQIVPAPSAALALTGGLLLGTRRRR